MVLQYLLFGIQFIGGIRTLQIGLRKRRPKEISAREEITNIAMERKNAFGINRDMASDFSIVVLADRHYRGTIFSYLN